jgi:predicted CoA-binding protein
MGSGTGFACSIRLNSSLPAEYRARYQNEDTIRDLILDSRTIAIIGASTDWQKASYFVMSYLLYEGYHVIPVNPKANTIQGQKCYAKLTDIPEPVDIVEIFRPAGEVPEYIRQAIAIKAKAVWTQLRIFDLEAAALAEKAGLKVVMDKCLKMEHGRFGGSLHYYGFNTEFITARKARPRLSQVRP